jgi:hypothetical protein
MLIFIVIWCAAIAAEIIIYLTIAKLSFSRALIVYLWNLISSISATVINTAVSAVVLIVVPRMASIISIFVLIAVRFLVSKIILKKKAGLNGKRLQWTSILASTLPLIIGFGGMWVVMRGIR